MKQRKPKAKEKIICKSYKKCGSQGNEHEDPFQMSIDGDPYLSKTFIHCIFNHFFDVSPSIFVYTSSFPQTYIICVCVRFVLTYKHIRNIQH